MKKFQYKQIMCRGSQFESIANMWGEQGWELVSVILSDPVCSVYDLTLFFKREISS